MAVEVATMVVGPLVKIVMAKASSNLLDHYKVMKGLEEQHDILKRKLPAILDIIGDAEQMVADSEQAAARIAGVTAWLEAIKKVAYKAIEVFDEFKYEALRRKAKKEGHYNDLGFSVVKLFPLHNSFIFRNRMGRKLRKVVQAIEILVAEMNDFHFKNHEPPLLSNQWREMDGDIFDPKEIICRSRAKDKKNIIDIVIGQVNNADLTVVPLVGMGGLGKTTLAQLVYNDPEIEKHFDVLLWVSVSDSFDVDSLAKSIVDAAAPEKVDDGTDLTASKKKDDGTEATASKKKTPLDILQNVVSGLRYLLVLDDVWTREDHKWEKLKARLEHGGMGSVVLTTTRDEGVAEIMGTVEPYNLKALEAKYIKEIIETRAFSCFQRKEDMPTPLVNMVGEIVKRCVGSPLAAKALGSLLRTKTNEEEWKAVSHRSNICTVESGILPILKLSYNNLPEHMKQCFAFCAIFPKDYEIDVDKLIQLWIAHGFIIEEKQVRLETIGKRIFNELASRSFFQDVKQVQFTVEEAEDTRVCYSRTTCKIHDLMHDVALSVMEKECALATKEPGKIESAVTPEEPSQSEWLPNTARHLFLSCEEPGRRLNISLLKSSPAIQTLLCEGYMESSLQHLSKYGSLHALQLCLGLSFPLKPKHLHHLRYLDLSRSIYIKALPEDLSILYNLQTLNLFGCISLCGLPRQLKYMTALRHLYTHGCPKLKSMPSDLRKLTCLQTLTCFVAGNGSNCSNVGELGHLNLGGQLELRQLENVTEEDAQAVNLVNKKELRELTLRWTTGCDDSFEEIIYWDMYGARVLEKLKPHSELHTIRIYSYRATTFPTWMDMLQNIVEIHLFSCEKLQWLFSHDSDTSFVFPNLKKLRLNGLDCLERWWEINNDRMQAEVIMFPRLEQLSIIWCVKLTTLPEQPTFPNLQDICIRECPQLTSIAESPKFSVLNMEGRESLPRHPTFPNLQKAWIDVCPEFITTAKSPKLRVLYMKGREDQLFMWVARHMTSLIDLDLNSLDDCTGTILEAAEHGLREVLNVKEKLNGHDLPLSVLTLYNFKSSVIEMCACFVHLQNLSVWDSDALIHWPEKEFRVLVSLRKLMISNCYNLTGYAQASARPSTSSETSQLLPRLEFLTIMGCENLVEVFNIPASLRRMIIHDCGNLESPFGRRVKQGQLDSASLVHQESSSIVEMSSSSPSGAAVEHLEELKLSWCPRLSAVLHLPVSLKNLDIQRCMGFTSLESRSGVLPSLEHLNLFECNTLSSLPDGPQAYSALQHLCIIECPGMKTLPASLQQRLGSIQREFIDAHYYGSKHASVTFSITPYQ